MSLEPRDFVHYLSRRIVVRFLHKASAPWFRNGLDLVEGFERPPKHVTRQRDGVSAQVRPGDRIWIVSQLFSPWGSLPPGMDACVIVSSVQNRKDGGFTFEAAPASRWFALVDARDLLTDLMTVNAKGEKRQLWPNPAKPIGQCLQRMRRLDVTRALQDWERRLGTLPLNFISYRIADGSRPAFEKARVLLASGQKVFWDRWCLPRRLAESREIVSDTALDCYLMQQLRHASVVWGIESPLYFSPDAYAQKECAEARKLGIYVPVESRCP